jgi:hypothetical protein
MKRALILILLTSCCGIAQDSVKVTTSQSASAGTGVVALRAFETSPGAPVQGAPYSATISNELIQTLADGNRIVQTSRGTTARDSQGRTRQDAMLPPIGNLSAANAPRLVFIQDPVAQTSYTLNLTDKTAQKMAMPPAGVAEHGQIHHKDKFFVQMRTTGSGNDPLPPPPAIALQKTLVDADEDAQVVTEDLGSQTMEGVLANGVRTTRTIPAGQIGNDRPISIVTEVWTSPDLKTVVYSKRSDPRMGEQTFQLKNIVRGEPDALLFTIPAEFKITDGPRTIIYRTKQ